MFMVAGMYTYVDVCALSLCQVSSCIVLSTLGHSSLGHVCCSVRRVGRIHTGGRFVHQLQLNYIYPVIVICRKWAAVAAIGDLYNHHQLLRVCCGRKGGLAVLTATGVWWH